MVSADVVQTLQDGQGLRVDFFYLGDRHAHRILLASADQQRRWLDSLEGDAAALWPASPPLQQLVIESRADGDVALLLGMAGRSHWSMSVMAMAGGGLWFDVACRPQGASPRLASTYRTHSAWQATGSAELACRAGRIELVDGARGEIRNGELQITPAPGATRWQYRVHAAYAPPLLRP